MEASNVLPIIIWSCVFLYGLGLLTFMTTIAKMTFERKQYDFNLTEKDFDFLEELQHEMLTQDTVCQAAPRFWVVGGTRKVATGEEYADGAQLICDTTVMADDLTEAVRHFRERIEDNFEDSNGQIIIEKEETVSFESYKVLKLDKDKDILYEQNYITSIGELVEAMIDVGFIDDNEYSIGYYYNEHYRYPNTMFLTNRSCKEHIKMNHYHYDETAHSYAMTAWRSSEVEHLWNILDKINWQRIRSVSTYNEQNNKK